MLGDCNKARIEAKTGFLYSGMSHRAAPLATGRMPNFASGEFSALALPRGQAGIALVLIGETLILAHVRPLSDYYFPFAWFGFISVLDAATEAYAGRSLLSQGILRFLILLPVSAAFWWIFELFDMAVHNWTYIGAGGYSTAAYVGLASLDFSTVLPAVWCAAQVVYWLLPRGGVARARTAKVAPLLLASMFGMGVACVVLPIALPQYAYGLIWGSTYLLLDPINCALGRPSMIGAVMARNWRLPVSFATGALLCGFFWEGWNYWAMPKWVYDTPHLNRWHIFEMPLPGYFGYLPFGLELFAMANFVFPLLRVQAPTLLGRPPGDKQPLEERHQSKERDGQQGHYHHRGKDTRLVNAEVQQAE